MLSRCCLKVDLTFICYRKHANKLKTLTMNRNWELLLLFNCAFISYYILNLCIHSSVCLFSFSRTCSQSCSQTSRCRRRRCSVLRAPAGRCQSARSRRTPAARSVSASEIAASAASTLTSTPHASCRCGRSWASERSRNGVRALHQVLPWRPACEGFLSPEL